MPTTSTERSLKFNQIRRDKGMKEWRVWVTPDEKEVLKKKLDKLRGKKGGSK